MVHKFVCPTGDLVKMAAVGHIIPFDFFELKNIISPNLMFFVHHTVY